METNLHVFKRFTKGLKGVGVEQGEIHGRLIFRQKMQEWGMHQKNKPQNISADLVERKKSYLHTRSLSSLVNMNISHKRFTGNVMTDYESEMVIQRGNKYLQL